MKEQNMGSNKSYATITEENLFEKAWPSLNCFTFCMTSFKENYHYYYKYCY